MGEDRIRYLLFLSGRWRWRPTKAMRKRGFQLVTFEREPGDSETAAGPKAKTRAIELNTEWDQVRKGAPAPQPAPVVIYPPGSVGDGYQRAIALRGEMRKAKGVSVTKDQEKRDDWPRAWKWLEPVFGDQSPKVVTPEQLLTLRTKVAAKVSETEAHRVIKVWRALWKKMQAFKLVSAEVKDPSLAFSNTAPDPRQETWQHREVLRLVQRAWRMGFRGLAAYMAVTWDTMLSPGDARPLTLGQGMRDDAGAVFFLDRAKTGRAAAGTLTPWSEAILAAYIKSLGIELLDAAPIFRTRGAAPGPKGGRRWLPRPYTQNKIEQDFRKVRTALFGKDEQRQLADMRRSGFVEGDAGGASAKDGANKGANTLDASNRLMKTYQPVNIASVRRFDDARAKGRLKLKGTKREPKSVMPSAGKVS
jgi:hypothetical protein